MAADYIQERLDRAVANDMWMGRFPGYQVINGDPRHSDHRPAIVTSDRPVVKAERGSRRSRFKFEASWLEEEKCVQVVGDAWRRAMNAQQKGAYDALKLVAVDLTDWSRNVLGDLEKRIKKVRKDLEVCRRLAICPS